jgi:hypothetical protein
VSERRSLPKALLASGRRCCLCVFLDGLDEVRKGQIAHLNRDPSKSNFESLVWLCLDHHDEYDSRTSQSKGLTVAEVTAYRDRLYARNPEVTQRAMRDSKVEDGPELEPLPPVSAFSKLRSKFPNETGFTAKPWCYPLWQVANEPDFFAYKSRNGADGICLLERIDLPDGRIVIVCISTPGNPGISISNGVEDICFQVCERFEIPPARLVWLEHYEDYESWNSVTFATVPPKTPFRNPSWDSMDADKWEALKLRPKKSLVQRNGRYESMLEKLFPWPLAVVAGD